MGKQIIIDYDEYLELLEHEKISKKIKELIDGIEITKNIDPMTYESIKILNIDKDVLAESLGYYPPEINHIFIKER